jgi:hypothetical protein
LATIIGVCLAPGGRLLRTHGDHITWASGAASLFCKQWLVSDSLFI